MNDFGEQIADYGWLNKTQRSWHLWLGNPFCVGRQIIPLKTATKAELVAFAKKMQRKEKARFVKAFPDVRWIDAGKFMRGGEPG